MHASGIYEADQMACSNIEKIVNATFPALILYTLQYYDLEIIDLKLSNEGPTSKH